MANQSDYWGGRSNFISFKRTCPRLREDSIPQGRPEGAGVWAWGCQGSIGEPLIHILVSFASY